MRIMGVRKNYVMPELTSAPVIMKTLNILDGGPSG